MQVCVSKGYVFQMEMLVRATSLGYSIGQVGVTAHLKLHGLHRVAMVMEKSWNFWNFEIFWNFWKSHGILTKIAKGPGKVMEF